MLKNLIGDIGWNVDWQDRTLPALVFYGGYRETDAAERCRKEYAQKIWDVAVRFKDTTAVWPVPGNYVISSKFGDTNGRQYIHQGIDIACRVGSNVVSVSSGIVVFAGWDYPLDHSQGLGIFVCIKDNTHLYFYGHLSQVFVSVGQSVKIGDSVGLSGNTGKSKGPHLHFQINDLTAGGDSGVPIDPLTILIPVIS